MRVLVGYRSNRGMTVLPMFSPPFTWYLIEVRKVGDPGEMMYDLNFNLIYGLITYVLHAYQLIPTISW